MNIKKNLRPVVAVGLCGAALLSGLGHAGEAGDIQRAIEYRQSVMTVFNWNMKSMGAMMKQKRPYDQAAFARHAQDLATAARLDLLAGFPLDSEGEDSDALPDIWLDFEDFQQKYKDMQVASNDLSEVAGGGDMTKIKPAFEALGKTCKACHRAYKD
jgi:cytochrome c556